MNSWRRVHAREVRLAIRLISWGGSQTETSLSIYFGNLVGYLVELFVQSRVKEGHLPNPYMLGDVQWCVVGSRNFRFRIVDLYSKPQVALRCP